MPKRTDIEKICIFGSGPIVIGQACEFDYAGTQGCKALRAEGYEVVLVNSNPATIMTDPDMADATYIEPLVPEVVAEILRKERPDAILPTLGGQTALNLALDLHKMGILDELGIEMLGARPDAIQVAEDREAFKALVRTLGLDVPRSGRARSLEEARQVAGYTGLPCVLRPSFTMGGVGAGIVEEAEDFDTMVSWALKSSPVHEVLIDESLIGWKEFEMEVVRDGADHAIIICAIENVDPMGIHTGDSITVAPAQTLTDREYQAMRDAAIEIVRGVGVETGGCNVQFTIDPATGRMLVIEMNPRVSRSSALASKATGYPIATVASLLAVGFTLDELPNAITKDTTACFEPTLDYIVTKIPRFAFEKFPGSDTTLTTQMKSVGEVMAIGRVFNESLQKALRGLEAGTRSLAPSWHISQYSDARLREELPRPQTDRMLLIAEALRRGLSVQEIHEACHVDPWFISEMAEVVQLEQEIAARPAALKDAHTMRRVKQAGLSDQRLADLTGHDEDAIRKTREDQGHATIYKRVDTCAAEFEARTPYLYSTFEDECEARLHEPEEDLQKERIVILGSGPNRIGQGIEFDYACVKAAMAVRKSGRLAVMLNCNPETVSTDHDISDRLYFEPIDLEAVLAVVAKEDADGVILQFGGQTPLRLARKLVEHGVKVLGTPPETIEAGEDRERFSAFARDLGLRLPEHTTAMSPAAAREAAADIGYPVLLRPSHVLGGRAMQVVHDDEELDRYLAQVFPGGKPADPRSLPLLIDRFLEGATELDVDAVSDGEDVVIGGVMEQVEHTGVHSGDSACILPPFTLSPDVIDEVRRLTRAIARQLGVVGLMNVQYAVVDNDPQQIYIIEVNPRGSRTVPFVSKATGVCLTTLATNILLGQSLAQQGVQEDLEPQAIYCKEVVLPFSRFPGVSPILSPEMRSTGEVMAGGASAIEAFTRAQVAAGQRPPESELLFLDVGAVDAHNPFAHHEDDLPEYLDRRIRALRPMLKHWKLVAPPAQAATLSGLLGQSVTAFKAAGEDDWKGLGGALLLHDQRTSRDPAFLLRYRALQQSRIAYFTTPESFALWRPNEPGSWQVTPLETRHPHEATQPLTHHEQLSLF